jgi:hypothetical protein
VLTCCNRVQVAQDQSGVPTQGRHLIDPGEVAADRVEPAAQRSRRPLQPSIELGLARDPRLGRTLGARLEPTLTGAGILVVTLRLAVDSASRSTACCVARGASNTT